MTTIFEKTTNKIHVAVEPKYEPDRSSPKNGAFVFSYQVSITNNRDNPIQIFQRSWAISDAYFNVEYIEGEGVVGEKPVINPGETYVYVSFCQLKTSFGSMSGHYSALDNTGKNVKIIIPEFTLAHPFAIQ